MVRRYSEELQSLDGVRLVPLDAEDAVEAAILRGSTLLSTADAIT